MARLRRTLAPEDATLEAVLAEAEASHVVLRLRARFIPATTSQVTSARFERAARAVARSESLTSLSPTQQRELLLRVFDDLGLGKRMREREARWAEEWRASEARRVTEHENRMRF